MPTEQVMDRVADDAPHKVPASTRSTTPATPPNCRADNTEPTYSPDPDRRSDRYRLVTPYLLRL